MGDDPAAVSLYREEFSVDRQGNYSLYGVPTESYLRGVKVTDANGQVTFVTYFPAGHGGHERPKLTFR